MAKAKKATTTNQTINKPQAQAKSANSIKNARTAGEPVTKNVASQAKNNTSKLSTKKSNNMQNTAVDNKKNAAATQNAQHAENMQTDSKQAENNNAAKGIQERSRNKRKKGGAEHTSKEGPLYKFFLDGLKDIYYAEQQILSGLSKMQKATTTTELEEAFEDHGLVTKKQVSRLEKVFSLLDEKAEGKKCDAILGILKEGESVIQDTEEGTMTRDAALIIAAQKVEHYEIASYGGLVALAETMGLQQVADLLDQSLQEEADTDTDLTDIAESCINFEAEEETEEAEA